MNREPCNMDSGQSFAGPADFNFEPCAVVLANSNLVITHVD